MISRFSKANATAVMMACPDQKLASPMAEWEIGFRKLRLVLSTLSGHQLLFLLCC